MNGMSLEALRFHGAGLNRPECVLAHGSGLLFASDATGGGGVAVIHADGTVRRVLARGRAAPFRPNGIALEPGGAVLLAHLGDEDGGVFRLHADGAVEPVLVALGGRPLPPTNFVLRDGEGRLWVSVSTRLHPRHLAYRPDAGDGFIVLIDARGPRIVADGLGYTNECVIDAASGVLYINETFGRRISAFRIGADGALHHRAIVASFGPGTFPDGLSLDEEGGLWVTSVVSNRLIRVAPDGRQEAVLEDGDPAHLAWVEQDFQAGRMGRPHVDQPRSRVLRNVSSLAFGGPDRRTGYLGSLAGDRLAVLDLPVAGHEPPHWGLDLGPLADGA